jgi:hypothetical protein
MTGGGGLGWATGVGLGRATGIGLGSGEGGGGVETVASALGLVVTGLSTAVDGLTWDAVLAAKALGARPQPLKTMNSAATRATDVLARATSS